MKNDNDILSSALIQSMARNFSVAELIRTTETLKQSGQLNSVETLYATWIEHNQNDPLLYAILFNYSVMLADAGKLAPARECLEHPLLLPSGRERRRWQRVARAESYRAGLLA